MKYTYNRVYFTIVIKLLTAPFNDDPSPKYWICNSCGIHKRDIDYKCIIKVLGVPVASPRVRNGMPVVTDFPLQTKGKEGKKYINESRSNHVSKDFEKKSDDFLTELSNIVYDLDGDTGGQKCQADVRRDKSLLLLPVLVLHKVKQN